MLSQEKICPNSKSNLVLCLKNTVINQLANKQTNKWGRWDDVLILKRGRGVMTCRKQYMKLEKKTYKMWPKWRNNPPGRRLVFTAMCHIHPHHQLQCRARSLKHLWKEVPLLSCWSQEDILSQSFMRESSCWMHGIDTITSLWASPSHRPVSVWMTQHWGSVWPVIVSLHSGPTGTSNFNGGSCFQLQSVVRVTDQPK